MLIKMTVRGIALDPITNMPIIILKDPDERRALPIWVGIFEANAIALELEKVSTPRPMTHDLLKNILEGLMMEDIVGVPKHQGDLSRTGIMLVRGLVVRELRC